MFNLGISQRIRNLGGGKPGYYISMLTRRIDTFEMKPKVNSALFYISLFLSFTTVLYLYISADATYDTGDGITHYLMSRYSWKHPHLLLDLWGKPFFTLVSSPFAQFGLNGMYVFQALNAAAISWFLFRIAIQMNLKYEWILPVLVFFAPVYFAVLNSGLVEIFFGAMFMFSVWLVFTKRFYASALVASLIPFVRPEAYVVMPLLLLVYMYRRKFLAIPLLISGSLVYTVAGLAQYKDIFWIVNRNYKLVGDNYEGQKGSYFHYFQVYNEIWGRVYTILLLVGIGIILYQVYRSISRKFKQEYLVETLLLFLGSTVGCFILHSLLCGMPGILNNLGILRYLAVLIPGSAMIALIGLNIINTSIFNRISFLRYFIVVAIMFLVVRSSFTQWYYPFRQNNEGLVMRQMGNYIQNNWPKTAKICFLNPLVPTVANVDPFDSKKVEMLWSADVEQIEGFPDSTLMLWDSHFMKGEGKIPLNSLLINPNLIMLKHYKFENEELPFEACLFYKVGNTSNNPGPVPFELVSEQGLIIKNQAIDSVSYTFDSDPYAFRQWISGQVEIDGKYSMQLNPETEFGPVFSKQVNGISINGQVKTVRLSFRIYTADTVNDMVTVVEVRNGEKLINWEGLIIQHALKPNQWNQVEFQHAFPEPVREENDKVNIYLWNKGKQKIYINDFGVIFKSRLETSN